MTNLQHSPNIGFLTAKVNGFLTARCESFQRLYYRSMSDEILNRINKRLSVVGLAPATASLRAGLSKDAIRNFQRSVDQGKEAGISTSTILKLAPILRTTGSWLLEGLGAEDEYGIPLMGYIGAGAQIEPDFEQVPPEGLDTIHLPLPIPDDMIAFGVRGDSMLPVYKEGHIIIVYRDQKRPLDYFYGMDAAVRTTDGRRFLKTIMRGRSGVTLTSWNAPPIEDVKLDWIGEIFAALPPSGVRKATKLGGIQGQLGLNAKTGNAG